MTPDDWLMLGVVVFISGISGMGLGYYIRDVQLMEYIKKINENMKELEYLANIVRKEKEDAD